MSLRRAAPGLCPREGAAGPPAPMHVARAWFGGAASALEARIASGERRRAPGRTGGRTTIPGAQGLFFGTLNLHYIYFKCRNERSTYIRDLAPGPTEREPRRGLGFGRGATPRAAVAASLPSCGKS